MFKLTLRSTLASLISVLALTGVAAGVMPSTALAAEALPRPAAGLSSAEIEGLQFMVQEEKLAHDLYLALGLAWGLPAFGTIAESESRHMATLAGLMDQFDVADPTTGFAAGAFSNADMQAMYDDLLAQGKTSAREALRVGALVEETDILDLQQHLQSTTQEDLRRVYENLLQGSTAHLRAFTRQWELETGLPYSPQVISAEALATLTADAPGQNGQRAGRAAGNGLGSGPATGAGLGYEFGGGGPGRGGRND
jgi:hypothetical protein